MKKETSINCSKETGGNSDPSKIQSTRSQHFWGARNAKATQNENTTSSLQRLESLAVANRISLLTVGLREAVGPEGLCRFQAYTKTAVKILSELWRICQLVVAAIQNAILTVDHRRAIGPKGPCRFPTYTKTAVKFTIGTLENSPSSSCCHSKCDIDRRSSTGHWAQRALLYLSPVPDHRPTR